jgi:hypothetical protein
MNQQATVPTAYKNGPALVVCERSQDPAIRHHNAASHLGSQHCTTAPAAKRVRELQPFQAKIDAEQNAFYDRPDVVTIHHGWGAGSARGAV